MASHDDDDDTHDEDHGVEAADTVGIDEEQGRGDSTDESEGEVGESSCDELAVAALPEGADRE